MTRCTERREDLDYRWSSCDLELDIPIKRKMSDLVLDNPAEGKKHTLEK